MWVEQSSDRQQPSKEAAWNDSWWIEPLKWDVPLRKAVQVYSLTCFRESLSSLNAVEKKEPPNSGPPQFGLFRSSYNIDEQRESQFNPFFMREWTHNLWACPMYRPCLNAPFLCRTSQQLNWCHFQNAQHKNAHTYMPFIYVYKPFMVLRPQCTLLSILM